MINQNRHAVDRSADILSSLIGVKEELKALKKQLDALTY
jgi:hypothetical protein